MDPVTIAYIMAAIAAAAGIGGTALANKSNNAQIEAQARQERAERFRQAELQRQADAELRTQIGQLTPEKHTADIEQAVAARTEATAPPLGAPAPYQAATPSAPVEVKNDFDRRMGMEGGKAVDEAGRRAKLAAFGDVSTAQDFQIGRIGDNLRQLQLQSAGNSRIFPYALADGTRNAGRSYARGADAANLIGQVATLYSMGGGKPAAKPASGGAGIASNPYGAGW